MTIFVGPILCGRICDILEGDDASAVEKAPAQA